MNKKNEELNTVNRLISKSTLKPNGVLCLFLIIFITGVFSGNGQKSPSGKDMTCGEIQSVPKTELLLMAKVGVQLVWKEFSICG